MMDAVHLHLALSHVPVVGVALAVLLLAWGLLRRNGDVSGSRSAESS